MPVKPKPKKGDLVSVTFTGIVLNTWSDSMGDIGVRISIDGTKPAWWGVVPSKVVEVTTLKEDRKKTRCQ